MSQSRPHGETSNSTQERSEADAEGPAQSADARSTAQQGTKRSSSDAGSPAQEGNEAATGSTERKGTKRAGEALETERKGLKENPKTGEKRPAPDEDPTLMELLNGLPTLHTLPQAMCGELLAAYPEHGRLEAAYDEKTAELLPLDKVKKARVRELDKMAEHKVKKDITYEEARKRALKIVKSRWVDGWKALPDDPQGVRSRCVAQEVNTHQPHQRDDVASGTPPLKAHRMVISHAATKRSGERENKKLLGRYDVSVAFFHAESTGKIAVVPPKDIDEGQLWYLLKAMNGTREASKPWAMRVSGTKKKYGFSAVASVPGLFYHPEYDLMLSCHGDDFLASGDKRALDFMDDVMVQEYATKVLPRIGAPQHGGQCKRGDHLHRTIEWTGNGYPWKADDKYQQMLVEEMGLQGAKGVDTPASKDTGKHDRDAEQPLSDEETSNFRRWTGIALYLSLDRPTIQFAVCDVSSGMSRPLKIHLCRLRRLVRYLIKFPTESWLYELQECPRQITVYTDSDWATDKARKSMSSYCEFFGKHLIETSCARQSVVALSSGEAEYYALTRGVAAGLMSQQVWEVMNFKLPLVARTDSSAGKGIASRVGVGKVKHLSLRELWLQDVVQQGRVVIRKEPTKTNVADLGTKALTGARTTELVRMMPLSRRGVMAAILMACLNVASAQPQGEEEDWDVKTFWIYLIIMHVLAIMGIMQIVRKLGTLLNRAQTAVQAVSKDEDQEKVLDKQVVDSPAPVAGPAGSPATQGPIMAKADHRQVACQ